MVGVDLAGGQPEIELECFIWPVTAWCACHYQWKFPVHLHQELDLLFCHIMFIASLRSATNVAKVNRMQMLFVRCITFALLDVFM